MAENNKFEDGGLIEMTQKNRNSRREKHFCTLLSYILSQTNRLADCYINAEKISIN